MVDFPWLCQFMGVDRSVTISMPTQQSSYSQLMVIGVFNHLRQAYRSFRFHETILSFGEPGSLGVDRSGYNFNGDFVVSPFFFAGCWKPNPLQAGPKSDRYTWG